MHLLAEEERMLEGAVLILPPVNVALHFMKLFKDSRVGCLVTAGGNIVPFYRQ
jgi:hypothetical protein